MTRFESFDTPLPGLKLIKRHPHSDSRGFFERIFCADELSNIGWNTPIAQINQSLTHFKGTIRGLHFQSPPHGEMKLISCMRGQVFDVALDIRLGSPTFGQWHAVVLSADNHNSFFLPQGFAHGFQAMTDDCQLLYLHSASYCQNAECGINASDSTLAIQWPLATSEISARDLALPAFDSLSSGVHI